MSEGNCLRDRGIPHQLVGEFLQHGAGELLRGSELADEHRGIKRIDCVLRQADVELRLLRDI